MTPAVLTINSRNYGAWSLRGWLLCRNSGLDFTVKVIDSQDPEVRAELLMLSPSLLVPRLAHGDIEVWSTIAIAEYLHELFPQRGLLPQATADRARCRSVSGEIQSGFANLRSALPMNLKASHPGFPVWAGARADLDRIETIWSDCLDQSKGPYLFGDSFTLADAMFAPVCTRIRTYDVKVGAMASEYTETVLALPEMVELTEEALAEPDDVEELEMEF
ncbi:MAG TPA: glutathione S-transferase [Acidimicrobiales bacterium]|nr:glutathione S-transferase [Acidimicrobiales bacterium]